MPSNTPPCPARRYSARDAIIAFRASPALKPTSMTREGSTGTISSLIERRSRYRIFCSTPINEATSGEPGSMMRSSGVPTRISRPSATTPTRSPRRKASPMSWVTSRMVLSYYPAILPCGYRRFFGFPSPEGDVGTPEHAPMEAKYCSAFSISVGRFSSGMRVI